MFTYSIIIPHKNIPHLLKRCLDSIPSRKDIQTIIVDDNSDPTIVNFDKFPGYDKDNIEIYLTKEDKGAGYARNIGLSKAKGKWILFADADDFFNQNFLTETDKYVDTDNDLIYFLATSVYSDTLNKAFRNKYLLSTRKKYYKKLIKNEDEAKSELVYKNWEAWAKMFNRNFIEKNKLLFEEEKIGEDALFVIKAGELSRKYFVSDFPIYCITYRNDSLCFKIISEDDFDQNFLAKVRINKYLENVKKNSFKIDLTDDIILSYRFGRKKMINIYKIAKENGNKIRIKAILKYFLIKIKNNILI
ncbi:glycosyltransferase family A protein [Apibacter mensalis]|uniref:glycosyltransferase family A protein n=1 Tax=Apibacter mensalis TaxID=1586267 RepID=UPI0026E9EE21|nr:glycosyltransferase family 2 protein [Apibacter mensalis]